MGFRTNAYSKVWEISPVSETCTKLRISVSKRNKETGEYEQEFSGYVMCIGREVAKKAAILQKGQRIKLGEVDVTTIYDSQNKKEYVNYKVFSFELDDVNTHLPDKKPVGN